jgi:iron complex outermembrane receptor protein
MGARVATAASTAELFALDRWQVTGNTTLVLAMQAVSADREAMTTAIPSGSVNHPQASYDRINPRFGVIHAFGSGASLYGNLSSLYEPPTNFELEDNVAGGNATLEAMHGTELEIGLRGADSSGNGSFNWDVSLFRAEIRDEILSVDDPLAPGTSLTTNVDRTVHAGIEALFGGSRPFGERGGSIEPLVSVTLNDFGFDRDAVYGNNELPGAPAYFVKGELLYRSPGGFFIGPTFDRVGRRRADFANTYQVDVYTLLGLRGGYARDSWRVFVDLRNLADKDYVAYHYVRDIAAPDTALLFRGEPLSAYVGFEFTLNQG